MADNNSTSQYAEPEDMGREKGGMRPDRILEAFFEPGDSYEAALMRARMTETKLHHVVVAISECMEYRDFATIRTLLGLLAASAGADGKAREEALRSVARTPIPSMIKPEEPQRWSRRNKPRDSEGTPRDIPDG